MLSTPSILVEWETGAACTRARVVAGLTELRRQLAELQPEFAAPAETIVCHDPDQDSRTSLQAALAGAGGRDLWPGTLRLVSPPQRLGYYQKKNFASGFASNEIIVFLDSDLNIEPGWLEALLKPFDDTRVSVLVGHTHLEARTRFERAVALFWLFGPRRPERRLRTAPSLVANNCAFRRGLFARFPFPHLPTFRQACADLSARLSASGFVLYQELGARASHPPPRGAFFLVRAFEAGRDQHYLDDRGGGASLGRCHGQFSRDLDQASRRLSMRRNALRADALDAAAGRLLGCLYVSVKAAGYLAALSRPFFATLRMRLFRSGELHQITGYTSMDRYPEIFASSQRLLTGRPELNILSFGCSTGEEVVTLRRYFPGARITGAEINPRSLAICRKRKVDDGIAFIPSDLELMRRHGPYDAIFCMAVFQRTPHLIMDREIMDIHGIYPFAKFERQVKQLHSLLKEDGIVVIHVTQYRFMDTELAPKYRPVGPVKDGIMKCPLFDRHGRRLPDPPGFASIYQRIQE